MSARQVKSDLEDCILIDIDRKKFSLLEIFPLLRLMEVSPEMIRMDKTRRGWHLIIPCKGMTNAERIAAQAILGSDPKREALNLMRERKGLYLNLLFEPKEK